MKNIRLGKQISGATLEQLENTLNDFQHSEFTRLINQEPLVFQTLSRCGKVSGRITLFLEGFGVSKRGNLEHWSGKTKNGRFFQGGDCNSIRVFPRKESEEIFARVPQQAISEAV